ncbi:hypothetical protein LTR20_009063 [Exophiala xenobiotica]|nr:hypothetical protein LTS13_007764 [Exophiala xenobiotica]KAK5397681.1 hypothetical protein LTR79_005196 [Exophiala xenobiotica]KAK5421220.1 hypothetical protein LTR90_002707 [Exophiala xenobiotica]KAK5456646.1 hypothetical protein LTR20_009063 [Exophiala xenobiotica]KAK5473468.1 hypothetical protein LTR26_010187 [Exophiala xenobiotica]
MDLPNTYIKHQLNSIIIKNTKRGLHTIPKPIHYQKMDKIKSAITGDAYDKPAMTKDGAMTVQDAPDAHTVKGTSAENKLSGDPDEVQNTLGNAAANKAKEAEKKTSN